MWTDGAGDGIIALVEGSNALRVLDVFGLCGWRGESWWMRGLELGWLALAMAVCITLHYIIPMVVTTAENSLFLYCFSSHPDQILPMP